MATHAISPLSVEAYLESTADSSSEYVDGRLLERPVPGEIHSDIQWKLCFDFGDLARKTNIAIYGRPELNVRVAEERVRIIDLAVYVEDRPNGQIPTNPPLIAIEILSPDDRLTDVLDKLADYRNWGVRHIWLIQPLSRRLLAYEGKALVELDVLEAPEIQARITPERLFEAAQ